VSPALASRYLDLLSKALTRSLFAEVLVPLDPQSSLKRNAFLPFERLLRKRGIVLARVMSMEKVLEESPPQEVRTAETLIGPRGLSNLQELIEEVLRSKVPGDLIEAGTWRGGAAIFMRGVLEAFGDETRMLWVADSFAGLPEQGTTGYRQDEDDMEWSAIDWLAVPLDAVKANFDRYGLLDDRVRFLPGWFHETLADAPIEELALMRLDADMYGSTMDALRLLYPKLSVGGYVVIDDYWLPHCRAAVDDFRRERGIEDEIVAVDRAIVYWRRTGRESG
jgi:O-methyltransferase